MKHVGYINDRGELDEKPSINRPHRKVYAYGAAEAPLQRMRQCGVMFHDPQRFFSRIEDVPDELAHLLFTRVYYDQDDRWLSPLIVDEPAPSLEQRVATLEMAIDQLVHALMPEEAKRIEELMKRLAEVEAAVKPPLDEIQSITVPILEYTDAIGAKHRQAISRDGLCDILRAMPSADRRYVLLDIVAAVYDSREDDTISELSSLLLAHE